ESSGEGVFGLDAGGRCTFLNPAGARLIGYPEEEVLGRDLRTLLLKGDATPDPSKEYLRAKGFAGGDIQHPEETRLLRKDGTEVEAECLTSPIVAGGRVNGAVVTLRNISQRKAVERERQTLLRKEQAMRALAEDAERRA